MYPTRYLLSFFFRVSFFFFNVTATTEIYTLSLHDALPIFSGVTGLDDRRRGGWQALSLDLRYRSEEHTSELQSRFDLVCRLLLEKKKNNTWLMSSTTIHGLPTTM